MTIDSSVQNRDAPHLIVITTAFFNCLAILSEKLGLVGGDI